MTAVKQDIVGIIDDITIDAVIEAIRNGFPIRRIAKEMHFSTASFFSDLAKSEDLQKRYAHARAEAADCYAEQIIEIASEEPDRYSVTTGDETTKTQVDNGWVSWQKTRIDALKWSAAKLKPKKYGDSSSIEHSGEIRTSLIPIFAKREASNGGQ